VVKPILPHEPEKKAQIEIHRADDLYSARRVIFCSRYMAAQTECFEGLERVNAVVFFYVLAQSADKAFLSPMASSSCLSRLWTLFKSLERNSPRNKALGSQLFQNPGFNS